MPHVLLVDDDRKLLSLLERGFRFEGFDVRTAVRGSDGLDIARAEPQDVVVLDIGMTDLNGFEVCRQLRADLDVPVIMLTARDDVEDKVHAVRLQTPNCVF
jgi:two-component system response regulator MprA